MTFAVDPENFMKVYSDDLILDEGQHEAWKRNQQGILVGEAVALANGWKLGDRIPLNSNIFSQKTI